MASALQASSGGSSTEPIIAFIRVLVQARSAAGQVITPNHTAVAIHDVAFRTGSEIEISIVEDLVAVLELYGSSLCERLDTHAVVLACGLLRLATPCLARHRGFFIFAECLNRDPKQRISSEHPDNQAPMVGLKGAVGKTILAWALKRFLEATRHEELRRALGAFLVALVYDNRANQSLLLDPAQTEMCLHLGTCALQDNSEILKLIAGSIICEMLSHNSCSTERFWPNGEESQGVVHLPQSRFHTSQWVYDFASFAEKHPLRHSRGPAPEKLIFAAAISLGPKYYSATEESAVIVIVSGQLNLALLSPTMDLSLYVVVPYDKIAFFEHGEIESQRKLGRYCIKLHMEVSGNSNHYVNAKPGSVDIINLMFDHTDDLRAVEREMLKSCPHLPNGSQTTALDVSSEQSSGTPQAATDGGTLSAIASDVMTAMVDPASDPAAYGHAGDQIDDRKSSTMQPLYLLGEHNTASTHGNTVDVGVNTALVDTSAASLIDSTLEPIDVSSSAKKEGAPLRRQKASHTTPTSKSRAVHNPADTFQGPDEEQDTAAFNDFDSLYDASSPARPKASTTRQQDAELVVPANLGMMGSPVINPRKQPDTFDSDLERRQRSPSQQLETGTTPTAADEAEAQEPLRTNAVKPHRMKLSQRLRDADGRTAAESARMALENTQSNSRGRALRPAADPTKTKSALSTRKGAVPKTITNKASSKYTLTVVQTSKLPTKRSQLAKPTQRASDDVNYDEAYELRDEDENDFDGQEASSNGTKGKKGRKTAVGKKKAKKAPAKARKPKAKTPAAPITKPKPRRPAAIKAKQAIQTIAGDSVAAEDAEDPIVDGDAEEQPVFDADTIAPESLEVEALVAPLTKGLEDPKPVPPKSLVLPPADALGTSKLSVVAPSPAPRLLKRSTKQKPQEPPTVVVKPATADESVHKKQAAPQTLSRSHAYTLALSTIVVHNMTSGPVKSLPPAGNGSGFDFPDDPVQDHFNEAMAITDTHEDQVLSDPVHAPVPDHSLPAATINNEAPRDMVDYGEKKQHEGLTDMPAPSTKPLSASKLQTALSGIPLLHPPRTEHPVRKRRVSAAKANSSAFKTKVPEASMVAAPESTAEPQAGQKRERGHEETPQVKRSRLMDAAPTKLADDVGVTKSTPKRPPPNINRKPNIVHFEPTGPANQGSSARKAERALPVYDEKQRAPMPENSHKRKLADERQNEPEARGQQTEKRSKLDRDDSQARTPRDNIVLPDQMVRIRNAEQLRKSSSQSSRVDENGSPQPLQYSRGASLAPSRLPSRRSQQLSIADDDLGGDENFPPDQDDLPDIPLLNLPLVKRDDIALKNKPPMQIISNRSKHGPSSPSATSSIVDNFAAFKEQDGGWFIDVRTAEIVAPQKPLDPFSVAAEEPQNDFMDLLRNSDKRDADESRRDKFSKKRTVNQGNSDNSDPDKTLIGGRQSDEEHASSTASESTTSGSADSSSPDDDPSDDGDNTTRESWRRALRPHQSATYDALMEIAHRVTQDLVSKEEAVRDLIEDYWKGGNRLIDEYEKARKKEHNAHKAMRDQEKARISELFKSAKEEVTSRTDKMKSEASRFKPEWEKRQRKVNSSIEELLAMAAE